LYLLKWFEQIRQKILNFILFMDRKIEMDKNKKTINLGINGLQLSDF